MTTVTTRVGNLKIPKIPSHELIITTSTSEVNKVSIIALDGLNRVVPTRTTPTITPVTPALSHVEPQTILGYQMDTETHVNAAGFVPPLVQSMTSVLNPSVNVSTTTTATSNPNSIASGENLYINMVHTKIWQGGSATIPEVPPLININNGRVSPSVPAHVLAASSNSSSPTSSSSGRSRKNTGGRPPNKENGISSEEERKKMIRRQRNKIAAAKCRKKRTELIQTLEKDVKELEGKKQNIKDQIQQLEKQKEDLRTILQTHQPSCHVRDTDSPDDIKPFSMNSNELNQQLSINSEKSLNMIPNENSKIFPSLVMAQNMDNRMMDIPQCKQRPNYLPVNNKINLSELGIPFSPPSTEIFDALIEGGTGLTPITSTYGPCSTQLRNTNTVADLSSPDSMSSKLVSL